MAQVDIIKDLILELAAQKQWAEIKSMMIGQHPADLAEIINQSHSDIREHLFSLVEDELKPGVLAELEGRAEADVLEHLSNDEISDLVEEMSPDDAADVIADLSDERSEEVLDLMEEEESEEVRELLKYHEHTAGGIMTTDIMALPEKCSVAEGLEHLTEIENDEPFYYTYIVDDDDRMVGYIGLWELLKVKDKMKTLGAIAHRDFVAAHTDMDQEEVAKLMSKYDLTALPVHDDQNRLVGRITVDDIMDVVEDEASEDILRMGGSHDIELDDNTALQACKARLPWLLITFFITCVGSIVLHRFLHDPKIVAALASLVPIIMAMAGSTGMQSSTLIIRGLSLGALEGQSVARLLLREVTAGLIMGVLCGGLLLFWSQWIFHISPEQNRGYSPVFLGMTAGLALLSAMTFAAIFGAFLPIVLNRIKVDPAVASGPFVTASNDILSLLIFYASTIVLIGLHGRIV